MSSHLLLHPVFDEAETSTGVAKGKVVHPAGQNRVDELHHPPYRLRMEATEPVFELAQQDGALRELGRIIRLPLALQAPYAPQLKAQESEALSFCQVNVPTLLFVDIDMEFGQFLSQPLVYCFVQPDMLRVSIHQNHQIVGEPCVLKIGVGSAAGGVLSAFQHP